MDKPSPIRALAGAFHDAIEDPETPQPLRDKLFSFAAQLRDELPPQQSRTVDAAEAKAVIGSFASDLTQSP
jgi:hypothetical protein